jgi:1-acyl-sn-glycerol-3-phosphate acyltransferase
MTDGDQTTPRPGEFTGKWDPVMLRRMVTVARPVCKRWFRSEVRGLERFPSGGALIVSNHSGGTLALDVPILWVDFVEKFGYERPIYTLAHDLAFQGPIGEILMRMGMIRASRDNAVKALRSGALVITFPGGDHDAWRPTRQQTTHRFQWPDRLCCDGDPGRRADRARRVDRRAGNPVIPDPR